MRCKRCRKYKWPWTLPHIICDEIIAVKTFREAKTNGDRARGVYLFLKARGLDVKDANQLTK